MSDKKPPTAEDILGVAPAEEERLHPVLSNERVRALQAEARAKVLADQEKAAEAAYLAKETERLKMEEGLVTGDGTKDEMVTITLDLAEHAVSNNKGGLEAGNITLSGRAYYHGHTYTVPRHVADTLREIQARGISHQAEIEGKGLAEAFKRQRDTNLSPIKGVTNAPQSLAA